VVVHVIIKLHRHMLASDRSAEPSLQLDDLQYFAFVMCLNACRLASPIQSANTYHISLREIERFLTPALNPVRPIIRYLIIVNREHLGGVPIVVTVARGTSVTHLFIISY
jgi:hypothetical protein